MEEHFLLNQTIKDDNDESIVFHKEIIQGLISLDAQLPFQQLEELLTTESNDLTNSEIFTLVSSFFALSPEDQQNLLNSLDDSDHCSIITLKGGTRGWWQNIGF